MKSLFANTPRGPIEYTLRGNGPVILFVHGTSCDCHYSLGFPPFLEAGFAILTPSRPGYGRTSPALGKSAAETADSLAALLDCLHIPGAFVIANSGGGPTGIHLAAGFPEKVRKLVLLSAISRTEDRMDEDAYNNQRGFYGPLHPVFWSMLRMMSDLSPKQVARQTLTAFSTHDPDDAMKQLTAEDIRALQAFYHGASSRAGALLDLDHRVESETLHSIQAPTLIVHSPEDKSVPFSHAQWSRENIPGAVLYPAKTLSHFSFVGPGAREVDEKIVEFLKQ